MDYADVARFCSAANKHAVALDACAIGMRVHGRTPELLLRNAQANDGLGRFDLAIADCVEALRGEPAPHIAALAHATLVLALESAGSTQAALDAGASAIAATPLAVEPHCAYGNVLAWHGAWEQAWPELECHWLGERAATRVRFGVDEWNGEELGGKRVGVVHGQGLGDVLQMARYLPRLRERCSHVTVECAPTLAALVRAAPGVDAVVEHGTLRTGDVDAVVRLMTLPRLFGERLDVTMGPYLAVPPDAAERWETLRSPAASFHVGLTWAGNPFHLRDRVRSLPLDACAPWAAIDGITWTSLQVGPGANDAAGAVLPLARYDDAIVTMADTAALIAQLDLVVTVDTAVAHLAGALGKPVWLMVSQRPDWRWSRGADTTPWYGSMRLFHANEPGWAGVIADVSRSLREASAERVQRLSADRVDKSADRPEVSDTIPRRAAMS